MDAIAYHAAWCVAPKKQLEAALAQHPDIIKIDGHIAELEEELKQLGDR